MGEKMEWSDPRFKQALQINCKVKSLNQLTEEWIDSEDWLNAGDVKDEPPDTSREWMQAQKKKLGGGFEGKNECRHWKMDPLPTLDVKIDHIITVI